MTLIIGAVCSDGVVLVADRRVLEGTDIATQDKIEVLEYGIIVAGAGTGEIIDKFNERIPHVLDERRNLNYQEMKKSNPDVDINDVPFYLKEYQFLEDCEGVLLNLFETYKKHIQILVGLGNKPQAELNLIETPSFTNSRRRTYKCIGSGGPYADLFLKKLWNENNPMTMEQTGRICQFIINFIANSNIDSFVGNGTQTVFIPDQPENFYEMGKEERKKYIPREVKQNFNDAGLIQEMNDFIDKLREKV